METEHDLLAYGFVSSNGDSPFVSLRTADGRKAAEVKVDVHEQMLEIHIGGQPDEYYPVCNYIALHLSEKNNHYLLFFFLA